MIAYCIDLACPSGESAVVFKSDLDCAIDDAAAYWETGKFSYIALRQGDRVLWRMSPGTRSLTALAIERAMVPS